jgi:hypothetical protein
MDVVAAPRATHSRRRFERLAIAYVEFAVAGTARFRPPIGYWSTSRRRAGWMRDLMSRSM